MTIDEERILAAAIAIFRELLADSMTKTIGLQKLELAVKTAKASSSQATIHQFPIGAARAMQSIRSPAGEAVIYQFPIRSKEK